MATWLFLGLVVVAICGGFAYLMLVAKEMKSKDHVFMTDVIEGKADVSDAVPTNMISDSDDTDYAADPGDSTSSDE